MVHKLKAEDFVGRANFYHKFIALVIENPKVLNNISMLDEAHFNLSEFANKENYKYSASNITHELHEESQHCLSK